MLSGIEQSSGEGELRVTVAGRESEDELAALRDWLTSEDALRGRVHWLRPPPEPGRMGGGLDVLSVVLGGGGVGSLLVPLCTWLTTRRPGVSVVIEKDDRKMSVDARRAADPMALVREAHELTFGQPDGVDEPGR